MIRKIVFFLFLSIGISMPISAQIQNLNLDQLSYINVDQLSNEQIQAFWDKVQAQGYSITDLETAARVKGVPVSQINKLRQRIMTLSSSTNKKNNTTTNKNNTPEQEIFGRTGKEYKRDTLAPTKKSRVFGYDFFQNPKISFTPTINVPTPESYIISTGDELLVEVW